MNFMESVEYIEVSGGKLKVKGTTQEYCLNNNKELIDNYGRKVTVTPAFLRNDFEVVGNWNLADEFFGDGFFRRGDVKKCRDYLKEDAGDLIDNVKLKYENSNLPDFERYLEVHQYPYVGNKLYHTYIKGVMDQFKNEEGRFGDL